MLSAMVPGEAVSVCPTCAGAVPLMAGAPAARMLEVVNSSTVTVLPAQNQGLQRASLLDETEAGEWENCWHVAGVLFETLPESWDEYRKRALKFYNSSDIEYNRQGSVPWNVTQPPHLSAQSDLYWAMRVGFTDAHSQNAGQRRVSLAGIADSLERMETITSGTAQRYCALSATPTTSWKT